MKKFQQLGRSLTKQQMKNVFGGMQEPGGGGGTPCNSNSDCPDGTITCPDGHTTEGSGVCSQTTCTCRLVGVCVSA